MDFFSKSEQAILLKAENIIVGFSGGADSTLALYATNEFLKSHDQTSKLTALYVDHQMHTNSTAWLKHCESFCAKQNITCLLYTSPSPRDKRQSRMPSSA